jgi:hypothetical protein
VHLLPSRRRLLSLIALLAATSLLAACGDDDATPVVGDEDGAGAEQGPALEHIHGLGVNPADGRLFIATHHGLFVAARDQTRPEQIGDTEQDIMGFSIVGADRFIGSGHPGPDQDLPGNLGLIESRDAGKTWKNISLLGDADFHVLQHSANKIYGFDGTQGRLMVSGDGGRSWQQRKPPAGVFGLAIDPTNSSRVVASTEKGIFSSTNEGGTWSALRNDTGGLLAWPARNRLYLVDGQGQVLRSPDAGANWQTQGSIGGQPAAFIAHKADLYAALADGTVKRSTDGGASWTVRTTPT